MIGLITLPNAMYYNYGGVLQNYALVCYLEKLGVPIRAIHCNAFSFLGKCRVNLHDRFQIQLEKNNGAIKITTVDRLSRERNENFEHFILECINPKQYGFYGKHTFRNISAEFEKVIVGSDQVWNPHLAVNHKTERTFLLTFLPPEKRISYAASFGVSEIPDHMKETFSDALRDFHGISVREEEGARIVRELTGRDVPVLVDPTMLLGPQEWRRIEKKSPARKDNGYILTYFLGSQNAQCRNMILKVAAQNDLDILELANPGKPLEYVSGPGEFVDLFDHASIVFTDSFHATVFAILFGKPFAVYNRVQDGMENMGSRIYTLLHKLGLESRLPGCVSEKDLFWCDYQTAYKRLEDEREKAKAYLTKACNTYAH